MIRRKDYVNSIVYYFNVCRIWKIDPVCFQGILGDLKSFTYDHYLPVVFDRVICFRTGLYCTDTACNRRNCVGGQIIDVKITIADVRHMLPDVHSVCRLLPESGTDLYSSVARCFVRPIMENHSVTGIFLCDFFGS